MKTAFRLLVVALLIGGWVLSAAALHVIYPGGRVTVIPKERLSFTDTYVDTRAWTLADVSVHPAVVHRIIETGKAELLLSNLKDPDNSDALEEQLREAMERMPEIEKKELVEPATKPVTARM